MKHRLSPAEFQRSASIDDAVLGRLETYLALLAEWNRRINLVSADTLSDPWRRHVLDSAQLMPLLPRGRPGVVDLGSGAGFPGLVLAIMDGGEVHLVESDSRKCAFLREAARITGTDVTVQCCRVEALGAMPADVVTARACAPLRKLLGYAYRLLEPEGSGLFLKGRTLEAELTEASKTWMMRATRIPSRSDPSGTVLKVEALRPRDDNS